MGKPLGILAVVAIQACSGSTRLAPPPSEETRAQIRAVRILNRPGPAAVTLDTPVTGWLAGIPAGACDVGKQFSEAVAGPGADQGAMLGIFAPVAFVIGAFYGPFAVLPAETVERDEKLLREILDQAGSGSARRMEAAAETACPGRIVRKGEDAVLHVGPSGVSLTGPYWLDPLLTPRLQVSARLIRADGKVLYDAVISRSGRPREFTRWAASPEDLRTCFDRALSEIAERLVEEIFLTLPPPELE
jgi:hypothetical protein